LGDIENFRKSTERAIEQLKTKESSAQIVGLDSLGRNLAQNIDLVKAYHMINILSDAIPYLVDILKGDHTVELKSKVLSISRRFMMFPEIFEAIAYVYKQNIEENHLSFEAGGKLREYEDRLEEVQEMYFEALHLEKEYPRLRAMKLIDELARKYQNREEVITRANWRNILLQIAKEDNDKNIRNQAWAYAHGSSKQNVDYFLQDVLKASLYDTLNKFQPNIQVPLSRIIELTGNDPYNRLLEIVDRVEEDHVQITKEQFDQAIKELIADKIIIGDYFKLEQVFVRKESKEQLIRPVSFSKEFICYYCGNPLEIDSKVCPSCEKDVLQCNVCKLPISFGEDAGKCSLCESTGHMVHFQEWVKTQGICPTCLKKLPLDGIVPISKLFKK